jgi:hypothetical protein
MGRSTSAMSLFTLGVESNGLCVYKLSQYSRLASYIASMACNAVPPWLLALVLFKLTMRILKRRSRLSGAMCEIPLDNLPMTLWFDSAPDDEWGRLYNCNPFLFTGPIFMLNSERVNSGVKHFLSQCSIKRSNAPVTKATPHSGPSSLGSPSVVIL